MNYKPWVSNVLSIVREVANNPNKNGLIIVLMIIKLMVLIFYIIEKNNK